MSELPFLGYNDVMKEDVPVIDQKKVAQKKPKRHAYYMAIILIIGLLGYIGYGAYMDYMVDHDEKIARLGIEYGVEQTILQIIEYSLTCQQVPLSIGNETINLIAVDCLKLGDQNG